MCLESGCENCICPYWRNRGYKLHFRLILSVSLSDVGGTAFLHCGNLFNFFNCQMQWCSPRDRGFRLEAPRDQKGLGPWSWSWVFAFGLGPDKKVLYTSLVKCQLTNSVPSLLQRISICMCTLHKHIASVFNSWKRDLMYRPTDFLWKLLTWGSCSRSRFVTMTATCRQTGSWIALRCMIQMLLSRPCFTANAGWPRRKTTESWRGLSTLRFGPHFPAITLQEL